MELTYINTTTSTSPIPLINSSRGCWVFQNNNTPDIQSDFIYAIIDDEGNAVFTTKTGYTKIFEALENIRVVYRNDSKIDLTTYGYGIVSVDELSALTDVGSKIFFRRISDYEIDRLLIYSVVPDYDCYKKILKYINEPLEIPTSDLVFKQSAISSGTGYILNELGTNRDYLYLDGTASVDTGYVGTGDDINALYVVLNLKDVTYGANQDYLIDNTNGSGGYFIRVASSTAIGITVFTSGGTVGYDIGTAFELIEQIAFRYEVTNDIFEVWVNGKNVRTLTTNGTITHSNTSDVIGAEYSGGRQQIMGLLGAARINGQLTEEEWLLFLDLDDSLSYDYRYLCEDGSGTTLTDSSGNGNNGTITNPTWLEQIEDADIVSGVSSDEYIPVGAIIDFTNGGQLEEVDSSLSAWNFNSKPDIDGERHFYKLVYDIDGTTIIGTTDHIIYRNTEEFWAIGYVTGYMYRYDRNFELLESIEMAPRVNVDENGDYQLNLPNADDRLSGRAVCKTSDGGYAIPANYAAQKKIWFFDKDWNYKGYNIDCITETGTDGFEAIWQRDNGNILVSIDNSGTIYEYSLGAGTGTWNENIGTYVATHDVSAQITQCVGLVQIANGNWYVLNQPDEVIHEYNSDFSSYIGVVANIGIRDGILFSNFQALFQMESGEWISSYINGNELFKYTSDFRFSYRNLQDEDASMIGIVANEFGPKGNDFNTIVDLYGWLRYALKDVNDEYILDNDVEYMITLGDII